jgi:integrase
MRVRLKGINSVTKKLADGTRRTYWYAWKGGPPLTGKPGTAEFIHSYNAAIATKVAPPQGKLLSVLQSYQTSGEFGGLAPRTRFDYIVKLKLIEAAFGDFPLSGLRDRRTRNIFKTWRDGLAMNSRRQADYAWQVLARVLSWGLDRGLVLANPCARGGRLYRGSRVDRIWTADDETTFLKRAPAHFHLALTLALWTGQRQGDLLRLPWSAYDGTHIRLRQGKTGTRVVIPVGAPLKTALCREKTGSAHSYKQPTPAVDFARLSSVMGHRRKEGRDRRRHVPRFAGHRCHAPRDRWLHRSGDRHHHRTLAARRSLDLGCSLLGARSGACRERNPEARKRNKNSQLIPNCGDIDSSVPPSASEHRAHIPLDHRTFLQ